MGQYYKIANLDKRQFLDPNTFNDGGKLFEFFCSSYLSSIALILLTDEGNNSWGSNVTSISWAGDRIVTVGEFIDSHKFMEDIQQEELDHINEFWKVPLEHINLYGYVLTYFKDISEIVLNDMMKVKFLEEKILEAYKLDYADPDFKKAVDRITATKKKHKAKFKNH